MFGRLKKYFELLFLQGVPASEFALCLVMALVLTSLPVIGVTTLLATIIAFRFKLNLAILIFMTYLLEPLRYVFFVPFTEFGSLILGIENRFIDVIELKNSFENGFEFFFDFLSSCFIYALLGWFIAVVIIVFPLYFLLKILFEFVFRKFSYRF